jgi:hypothetical protein
LSGARVYRGRLLEGGEASKYHFENSHITPEMPTTASSRSPSPVEAHRLDIIAEPIIECKYHSCGVSRRIDFHLADFEITDWRDCEAVYLAVESTDPEVQKVVTSEFCLISPCEW